MLRNILIAVAAVVVVLLVIIATRSPTYRVSRSITVAAPPAVVYAQIIDFHKWDAWDPWAKIDPAVKRTYAGPASGPGAAYGWSGNDKVGEGKMLITGAKPDQEVNIKLDFIKPFEATSLTGFSLEPAFGGAKVTWTMAGDNNFVMKAMSLFQDMDASVGKDFEKGLLSLKSVSEVEAKRQAEAAAKKAAADAAAAAQAAADAATAQAAAAAAKAKPAKARK
jgi:Polyketide cyclase / dehydrase and lipid transport